MAKKPKVLCEDCAGMCCRYFAMQIDTPEDKSDFEDIRWYLAHENVSVFVEDGSWFANIKNKCRHLSEDNHKCMNYDNRPPICRKYNTENCDFTSHEYQYELHFTDDRQMAEYIKVKFDNNKIDRPKKKKAKSKTKAKVKSKAAK
jgi:Fe-S-cluster containining protein